MTETDGADTVEPKDTFEAGSPESDYVASRRKSMITLLVMAVLTFLAMAAALSLGAVDIPFSDTIKILILTILCHSADIVVQCRT